MQFWFPELLLSLDNVVLRAVCCLKAGIVADDMQSKVVPINWLTEQLRMTTACNLLRLHALYEGVLELIRQ